MITTLLIASYILIAWGVMARAREYFNDKFEAFALGALWPACLIVFLATWPIWIKD